MTSMAQAYDMAAVAVRQRLADQHPERLAVLDGLSKRDVSVYKGAHDSVEEVLRRLRVPFEFNPSPGHLQRSAIAFANCTGTPQRTLRTNARPFVRDGGWLVSTDWCLESVVEHCFPGVLARKRGSNSGDEVVAVEPNIDGLWSDVVILGADPQWWLEASSYPIEILDSERVHVEAASHELLVKYDAPVVAARFDWRDGHVYHVISHMWLKRTRTPQQPRYGGPDVDFLREGMRLSERGIETVLTESGLKADAVNFASLQSAATATELVAQLCIEAVQRGAGSRGRGGLFSAVKKAFS
jgi:hypothetical protein